MTNFVAALSLKTLSDEVILLAIVVLEDGQSVLILQGGHSWSKREETFSF